MGKNQWELYFDAVKTQNWEKALNALNAVLKKEPKNPQVHLKVGDVLQKAHDIAGSIKAYHESAQILIQEGFFHKAIAVYKVILRLDPKNDEAISKTKKIMTELEGKKTEHHERIEQVVLEESKPIAEPGFEDVSETSETIEQEVTSESEQLADQIPESEVQREGVFGLSTEQGVEETSEVGADKFDLYVPAFLKYLPDEEREEVLNRTKQKTFSAGEEIIREGEHGDSVFIIRSGTAKVTVNILNKEIELATLKTGDIFGEVAFLTGRPRTASVMAIDDIEVVEFNREILEDILNKHPESVKELEDFYQYHFQDTLEKVRRKLKR